MLRAYERKLPCPHVRGNRKPDTRAVAVAVVLIAWCAACAERIPDPIVEPTVPHISWLVEVQTASGQERTVCQSDPRSECVLPASTADNRTFATVHLYLHPVKSGETKYSGTMRVGFLNGTAAEAHDSRVDSTVSRGDSPTNISVTGIVARTTGAYTVAISLVAAPASGSPLELRDTIPVTVK